MNRLQNKIALVTGAAMGIGLATARLFAQQGATVILSDILDEIGRAEADLIGAEYLHLDVSSESDWQTVEIHISEKYGRLDVVVNNAGITGFLEAAGPHDPENLDMASWQQTNRNT